MAVGDEGSAIASIVRSTDDKGYPIIQVTGELDLSNVNRLRSALNEIFAERPARLAIELSGLTFMDSSGIALLVEAAQRIDTLELQKPSPLIRRVLQATGVSEILRLNP